MINYPIRVSFIIRKHLITVTWLQWPRITNHFHSMKQTFLSHLYRRIIMKTMLGIINYMITKELLFTYITLYAYVPHTALNPILTDWIHICIHLHFLKIKLVCFFKLNIVLSLRIFIFSCILLILK